MSANNRALAYKNLIKQSEPVAQASAAPVVQEQPAAMPESPKLRVMPLLRKTQPRRFVRVPTHAVGVHLEQPERPRAALRLPLKLRSVAGHKEGFRSPW